MGVTFRSNPFEQDGQYEDDDDDDWELNADEEWITLPNDSVIEEDRMMSPPTLSDIAGDWYVVLENLDQDEHNVEDFDNFLEEPTEVENMESVWSERLYSSDSEDDIDYVTYAGPDDDSVSEVEDGDIMETPAETQNKYILDDD